MRSASIRRFGTIFATGIGGLETLEEQIALRLEKGNGVLAVPRADDHGQRQRRGDLDALRPAGPNETICTACAAGTHAIGYAARLIAWDRCDAVVTGGSEAAATARRSPASAT